MAEASHDGAPLCTWFNRGSQVSNRWTGLVAPKTEDQSVSVMEEARPAAVPVLRGAQTPQQGISAPAEDRRLGQFLTSSAGPFWLGAHGGAGETTLMGLLGGFECHHRWPSPAPGASAPVVVLVARQTHRGLEAARLAAQDWAAGGHPEVLLAGLVVVAAVPGKTPRALRGQTRVTAGGVPRTWTVPWIEGLHLAGTVETDQLPKGAYEVLTAIDEALTETTEGKN
jgi:hypothetical protein